MRVHDWPELLIAFLDVRERRPFRYGKSENDCCSFGAQWVRIATGVDAMIGVPDYASAEEADLILSATPLDALLDQRFPRRENKALAQRGDVGLALMRGEPTLVIVEGSTLVGPGKRGLERLPRVEMQTAWEV